MSVWVRIPFSVLNNLNNMISKTEKQWQAESDANILAQYNEIVASKSRMNAAIKAAKTKASNLQQRANAMAKVAKRK